MTFEDLKLAAPILKAIAQCGHTHPTPIQERAIPCVCAGRDLIASAQTGTGKTAAFVLPALHQLATNPVRRGGPKVLVLTPTRELADQISQATRLYGKFLRIKSTSIFGGMPFAGQIRALSQSPEIIIATPGRMLDHMDRGRIDLSQLQMFILDEADRMLDMGFSEDVERISNAVPSNCQTLLFAATLGNTTTKLALKLLKDPERVEIQPGRITHDKIEQRLHVADNLQHKNRLLKHLCEDSTVTRAIIFSATKRDADHLAVALKDLGYPAAALHGDMSQSARNRTMLNMRHGRIRLLVATDVAARGIDVTGISHVINFDLPKYAEDYVHRIGRTGRAGDSGIAISFASRSDLPYLTRIERYLGKALPIHTIPGLEPTHSLRVSAGGRRPINSGGKKTGGPYNKNSGPPSRSYKHTKTDGRASFPGFKNSQASKGPWSENRKASR